MSNNPNNMSVIQAYTMNFSKSSRNFILRVILFLLMIVAGENVMGQGYTIIKPDGQSCISANSRVEVVLDDNIENLKFISNERTNCSSFKIFDFIEISGGDCGEPTNLSNVTRNVSSNSIFVDIPTLDHIQNGEYVVYYGRWTQSKYQTGNWVKITWWSSSNYTRLGTIRIPVCTPDPVIRTESSCACPGDNLTLQVENFSSSNFHVSVNGNNVNNFQNITYDIETLKGEITFKIPENVNSDMTLLCWTDKDASTARTTISLCTPRFIEAPNCSNKNKTFPVKIINACPSITYTLSADGGNVDFSKSSLSGSASYDVNMTITQFSSQTTAGNTQYYKNILLKKGTTTIDNISVTQCNVIFHNLRDNVKENVEISEPCYAKLADVGNYGNPVLWDWVENGDNATAKYRYCEVIEGNESEYKDVIANVTRFESGKKYKLKALLYSGDNLIQTFETKVFTIIGTMTISGRSYWGGSVSVTQDDVDKNGKSVDCGSVIKLTAIPENCKKFQQWQDGNKENPRYIVATESKDYVATFENDNSQYTISATATDGGTVKIDDGNSASVTKSCGSDVKLEAIEDYCGIFEKWNDGNTNPKRTVKVSANATYEAIFKQKDFKITASSNNESLGTVAISGTNSCGNTVTITATPKACSDFVQWNDGNTNKERTVEVTENQNFVATFTNASNFTLTCKDYSFLKEDAGSGNATVTFPLPEVSAGTVDSYSWSVSNGLNVSSSNVTGTLSFGENSVTITATKCGHSESCTTTVKLLKSVTPCEK
ncbi:MAG: hypothetical protein MJZ24_10840 [Paludibacteraceae bacterium]|nr:hypothetical protein [Paludibacteraceae bacterium]